MISSVVDVKDHYSYFDETISAFNFLKCSDRTWRLFNSSLHYQNRLRAPEYRRLHESAGFQVVEEVVEPPREADLSAIRELRIARRFRGYSPEELATRAIALVALKGLIREPPRPAKPAAGSRP